MTFTLFNIPDSLNDIPGWLEDMILSNESEQFLTDLYAVSKPNESQTKLNDLIAANLKARVMREGIRHVIQPELARNLMKHPSALEVLIAEIALSGQDYWTSRLKIPNLKRISSFNGSDPMNEDDDDDISIEEPYRFPFVTESLANPAVVSIKPKSYRRLVTFALAASVLVIGSLLFFRSRSTEITPGKNIFQGTDIVKGNTPPKDPNVAWGWSKPDVFAVKMTAPGYLVHLSDTAYEWFKEKPANSNELRARLVSFRQGCDRLRDAKHESLKDQDRTWLIERCNQWSTSIDELIARVDKGDPFRQVSNDADKLVGRLVNTLQVRSNESS